MKSKYTINLGLYIRDNGISLAKVAAETGLSYTRLYNSLFHKKRNDRDLRIGEYMAICEYIGVSPLYFATY